MNWDHLINIAGTIVAGTVAWLVSQWSKLKGDVADLKTSQAVLKAQMDGMPQQLAEIKGELKGIRKDISASMDRIHARIDSKADK